MLDYTRIINELERSDLPEVAQNELRAILKPEGLQDTLKRWLGQRDFAYQETRFARFIALELAWAERTEEQEEDDRLPPTTFPSLFPKASQIAIKGQLTLGQFLRKEFIVLGTSAQLCIHPLPKAADTNMPVVMDLNEIPAAIQALKALPEPEENTLENRINHQSAQELVQSYETTKPATVDALKAWIGSRDVRACRAGYTGTPYSAVNALCAQIAWLCLDKTEKNAEESFWKILTPEIMGVLDGMDNDQWPVYGEALLDETAPQLINYRGMVEHSDRITGQGLNDQRIQFFCEDHLNFWAIPRLERKAAGSALKTLKFKNLYEFFCEMSRVLDRWSTRTQGGAVELNIPPQGYMDIAPFQQVLIALKNLRTTIFPKIQSGGVNLATIVANLIPEDKDKKNKPIKNVERSGDARETCFNGNKQSLLIIIESQSCIKALENISLEGMDIPSPFDGTKKMQGRDKLYYLPRHYLHLKLKELSDDELINLIKGHEKHLIKLSVLAEAFKIRLQASPYKGKLLYDRVLQLNERTLQVDFLKAVLGEDLDFSLILVDLESSLYALKLCDKVVLEDKYKSALKTQIEKNILPVINCDWPRVIKAIQVVGDFEPDNWHFIIQGLMKWSLNFKEMVLWKFVNTMLVIQDVVGRNDRVVFASCVVDHLAGFDLNHLLNISFRGILNDTLQGILPSIHRFVTTENNYLSFVELSASNELDSSKLIFETLSRRIGEFGKDFENQEGKLGAAFCTGLKVFYYSKRHEIPNSIKQTLYPWLDTKIKTPAELSDYIMLLTGAELTEKETVLLEMSKRIVFTSMDLYKAYNSLLKIGEYDSLLNEIKQKIISSIKSYADYCIVNHMLPPELIQSIQPKFPEAYLKPAANDTFPLDITFPTFSYMIRFMLSLCETPNERQEVFRYFAPKICKDHNHDKSLFLTMLDECDFTTQLDLLTIIPAENLFRGEWNGVSIYDQIIGKIKSFKEHQKEVYELIKPQLNDHLIKKCNFAKILKDFSEVKEEIYRWVIEDERVSKPSGIEGGMAYQLIEFFPEKLDSILKKIGKNFSIPAKLYRSNLQVSQPEAFMALCKYLVEYHSDKVSQKMKDEGEDLTDAINFFPIDFLKGAKFIKLAEDFTKNKPIHYDILIRKVNPEKLLIAFDLFAHGFQTIYSDGLARALNQLPLDKALCENFLKRLETPWNLSMRTRPSLNDYGELFSGINDDRMDFIGEIFQNELEIVAKDHLVLASVVAIVNKEAFKKSLAKVIIEPKMLHTYSFKALVYLLQVSLGILADMPKPKVTERLALTLRSYDDYLTLELLQAHYGVDKEAVHQRVSQSLVLVKRLYPLLAQGSIFHLNATRSLAQLDSIEPEERKLRSFFLLLQTDGLLQKAWGLVCMTDPAARLEATVKACTPITQALYRPSVSTAAATELREKVASVFKL